MKIYLISSLFIVLLAEYGNTLVPYSFIQGWSYTDSILAPSEWGTRFPNCKNVWWQSPVDVPYDTTGACLDRIQWLNLDWPRPQTTLQNAWRNVKINFPDKSYPIVIKGGPLPKGEEYYLASVGFHVGATDESGSNHIIRGKQYPGEWTLLFTNNPNANETNWPQGDSIVVLSFLIEISSYDNLNWDSIVRALPALKRAGTNATVDLPSLRSLLPQYQDWESSYLFYIGSIAIPPCNEHATRVVYTTPINLSSRQVNAFRQACDEFGELIVNNQRPLQPGRHNQNLRAAY